MIGYVGTIVSALLLLQILPMFAQSGTLVTLDGTVGSDGYDPKYLEIRTGGDDVTLLNGSTTVIPEKPPTKGDPPGKKNKGGSGVSDNSGVLSGPMFGLVPTADVSVSTQNSVKKETELYVEKSKRGETRTFLKFEVSGVTDVVVSAKILLHSIEPSKQGGTIAQVSSTDWLEDTMTWNNQPEIDGSVLSSVDAVRNDDYYEWDVTSAISVDGTYTFALTCKKCSSKYDSSEAESYLPYLIVVMADDSNISHTDDHEDLVIVGAGDIASCIKTGDEETAKLLDNIDGTVYALGDNVYPDGTDGEFANCYDPTWGRHKARTYPSVGNHEYRTPGATGYFNYFGAVAGDPSKGYYSYDLGEWHIVVINSNCLEIIACENASPQVQWLRDDLAAYPSTCAIAYMHHPRFSSGHSQDHLQPIWQALYDAGTDVVIGAHHHSYERFAPQDPYGVTDLDRGIRQFVAGTGGYSHYSFNTPIANSEAMDNTSFGVLKLTLHPSSYDWEFIPVAGSTFSDSGTSMCH
ncbi:MAG: DNRLRE domain-containing protein [Nitrososphaerales archaeon]